MRRPSKALGTALLLAFGLAVHAGAVSAAGVTAIAGFGTTVSDLDRAVAFYTGVLGFEKESEVELAGPAYETLEGVFGLRMRVATLRLGAETLALTEYLAPEGRPIPEGARSNDRWFQHVAIVVSDMDRAYAELRRHRVRHASPEPQELPAWNPAAGGIRAFYFKDPDGHALELIWFPEGKGDARWQQPTERLFLGIDHTAIVVEDTAASLAFYRDRLGLRVAGSSENHGPEQERLNNVKGARLRITSLRGPRGPGVELLEYLAPLTGRPRPPDAAANDLLHWETAAQVDDVVEAEQAALAGGGRRVSDDIAELPEAALGFRRAALVADPDGHVLRLAEETARARTNP